MRKALRRGGYSTLNVYIVNSESGILGVAAFPVRMPSVEQKVYDGVVVLGASLPGGGFVPYDLGATLTRESSSPTVCTSPLI